MHIRAIFTLSIFVRSFILVVFSLLYRAIYRVVVYIRVIVYIVFIIRPDFVKPIPHKISRK